MMLSRSFFTGKYKAVAMKLIDVLNFSIGLLPILISKRKSSTYYLLSVLS